MKKQSNNSNQELLKITDKERYHLRLMEVVEHQREKEKDMTEIRVEIEHYPRTHILVRNGKNIEKAKEAFKDKIERKLITY